VVFVIWFTLLHIHVVEAATLQQYTILLLDGKRQCIVNLVIVLLALQDLFNRTLHNVVGLRYVASQLLRALVSSVVRARSILIQTRDEDVRELIQAAQQLMDCVDLHGLVLLFNFDQAAEQVLLTCERSGQRHVAVVDGGFFSHVEP